MKKVIDGEADLLVGMCAITPLRLKHMDCIKSHMSFPFLLIVPPGAEFTPFEKLLRPFHLEVWLMLCLVFICGFWFILVISTMGSVKLKHTIFGEHCGNPYLNMLDIAFGGSMKTPPRRNFPRLLFATFILFCLVIRSLYQGLLFEFLQSDNRAIPVMTIDEMIEKDFYFYMYNIYQEHTHSLKIHERWVAFFRRLCFKFLFNSLKFQKKSLRIFRK